MSGVQRFLPGHKNHIRQAIDFDGPVKPITDAVLQRAISRFGSSFAGVAGTFTGKEQAEYEVEVLDTTPTVPIITQPTFAGAGNGNISNITESGLSARSFTVELADLGTKLLAAGVDIQGVSIKVRIPGNAGNTLSFKVDRSALTFTPAPFSLLNQLNANATTLLGPEFDWDTATIGADNVVPSDAHRVIFGNDKNHIYTQWKEYKDGDFTYFFQPAIIGDIPAETQIQFVDGTYTVELYDGVTLVETYAAVRTLYDLLNAIKTTSTILLVEGAVGRDGTPGGNDVADLQIRTDAYASINKGSGSSYATGFTDVDVAISAGTQLVTAVCAAATPQDGFGAGVGSEVWEIRSSIGGSLGTVKSGDTVVAEDFTAVIPRKLPPGFGTTPTGTFDLVLISYQPRPLDESGHPLVPNPGICVNGRTLGINAQAQQITLTYTKRPPIDGCSCKEAPYSLDPECLGIVPPTAVGAIPVSYQADTVTKLVALYGWLADTVRSNSEYLVQDNGIIDITDTSSTGGRMVNGVQDPFISNPLGTSAFFISGTDPITHKFVYSPSQGPSLTAYQKKSLFDVVGDFEKTVALIDKLPAGAYRIAAMAAWDDAATEFRDDVDTMMTGTTVTETEVIPAAEDLLAGDLVVVYDLGAGKQARKAIEHPAAVGYGYCEADTLTGIDATIHYFGEMPDVADIADSADPPVVGGTEILVAGQLLYYSSQAPGKATTASDAALIIAGAHTLVALAAGATPYKFYLRNSAGGGVSPYFNMIGLQLLPDRYNSRMKHILISGGISPLGKSDASGDNSGDGCWQDSGDPFYWTVEGEVGGFYAPAFNNSPYYSSKKRPASSGGDGSDGYYSTKEFGFYLYIPCPENLLEGDQVTLKIGQPGRDTSAYQKGDVLTLGIVAAQNVQFGGGRDGDNIQTWYVTDDEDGPRAPYLLDTSAPVPYDDTAVSFEISQGVIPYQKGDQFAFAIEGGHYRWRKTVNGAVGAWSGTLAIGITPVALDSGLSLTFTPGATPAFFTGDIYKFLALQPYAISNVLKPDFDMWQWGAMSPVGLEIDLGAIKPIEAIGFAFHTIPEGATVQVDGGDAAPDEWTEVITWQKDVMASLLATPRTARYLILTIVSGSDGGIGYLYVGEAQAFTHSAQVTVNREYKVKRSTGEVNPASLFQGRALGGQVQWPEGHLAEADYEPMVDMLDFIKTNDDEPLIFFPQHTRQSEVILASVESDSIAFNDVYNYQPDQGRVRRLSCTIPLKGVSFQ